MTESETLSTSIENIKEEDKVAKDLENIDSDDLNAENQRLLEKVQEAYNILPPGWKKNEKTGSGNNQPPFLHEDGRVSWKHPKSEEIRSMINASKLSPENGGYDENKRSMVNKYRLMAKRGVPIEAVKQRARVDGINLEDSDLLGYNSETSSTSIDGHDQNRQRQLKKYRLMVKRGVPIEGVKQRARVMDGIIIEDSELLGDNVDSSNGDLGIDPSYQHKLKKYRLMANMGAPIEAVKQKAKLIDYIDLKDSDLMGGHADNKENEKKHDNCALVTQKDKEVMHEISAQKEEKKTLEKSNVPQYFKPLEGGNQIEFTNFGNIRRDDSMLSLLVKKLILTVNKARSTGDLKPAFYANTDDLYNALGALHGVRFSRDTYNSTCFDFNNAMTKNEVKSKRKPFLELLRSLGARLPRCDNEVVDVKGLDELILYVEKKNETKLTEIKDIFRVGMYDFNSLSAIYTPGSRVIAKNVVTSGVDMICEVSWNRYEQGKTLFGETRTFKVCFQFIVAVGEHFTMCEYVESIENFQGRRHLQSLNFVPLHSYDCESLESLHAEFFKRGELYARCAIGAHFMAYEKASFFAKAAKNGKRGGNQTAALRVGGRIMVDTQGSYEAGHSIGFGNDAVVTSIKQKYKEYMLVMRSRKKKEANNAVDDDFSQMILFDEIPSDYIEMSWPVLVGFSFTSKSWGEVLVDGLSDIRFNESAFDNLVLTQSRKRMVKALVRHSNSGFNDIVSGKGEGSVFLLYGPPGCGKTLTAEAISEMLHRPLYSVSLGQLGVSPMELETRLGEVLDLCSRWDALILLDEADIFLEKRSATGTLERNAMVSVMLRLVEYFKGTLFLTSNRVDALDPAFKTRITLGLRYDPLDAAARQQVWINLLKKSGFAALIENGTIQVDELAAHELNGREIKNAIRLAMALAEEDKEIISQKLILETIDTYNDFNEKMTNAESY